MINRNRTSRTGRSSARGDDSSLRRRLWRSLLPWVIAAAFVFIGAALILLYRGGDERPSAGDSTVEPALGGASSGAAPPFTLPSLDGREVTLSGLLGDDDVLLFFNEGVT